MRDIQQINKERKERNIMENKQDKGFTLVELLIVIVILGILATVTVFAVRGITDQGQQSACDADEKTLQTGVETWFAQYGGDAIPGTSRRTRTATPSRATTPQGVLQEGGFIVEPSTNYYVAADGTVVATNPECRATAGA